MANYRLVHSNLLLVFLFSLLPMPLSAARKSYVVYMGSHPPRKEISLADTDKVTASHREFLGSFLGSKKKAKEAIFYSYTKYINGFAAVLEEEHAAAISNSSEVMAVFPNERRLLHTTRSWEFLGYEDGGSVPADSSWTKARFGENTIIGNLDTGVWPESASFNDNDLGPVPSKWKGACESGSSETFECNRKLIGSRSFNKGYVAVVGARNASAEVTRDVDGHGTHTLAIAGGAFVPGANVFGLGNGTAKGGSPKARLAAYKVCWPTVNGTACFDADIIAAFDAAIHDGVDVLSVSLGAAPRDYFIDGIAIGSFHAVKHGIIVVCSAGNDGPYWQTVSNIAPWIFTVAASTIDREFSADLLLGNGKQLKGQSLSNTILPPGSLYPVITSIDARLRNATLDEAGLCYMGSLDPEKVRGKIVVCLTGNVTGAAKSQTVLSAGGMGMILRSTQIQGNNVMGEAFFLPAVSISYRNGRTLQAYISSVDSPVASIRHATTVVGTKPSPYMAYFSSRGPNIIDAQILKPDITAPGVSIISAFTEAAGPSNEPYDTRRVRFNSISGTSMACPHISGIAGLLKTLHPDWSPAAIKSAIMTTAATTDSGGNPILDSFFFNATPFSYGAGHVNPNRAMDPGLVYDLTTENYLDFLCGVGYNSSLIATFAGTAFSCPPNPPRLQDLNYPSITVLGLSRRTSIRRTLKNVGTPGEYSVEVNLSPGISVSVKPETIVFCTYGQEESFNVTFEVTSSAMVGEYVFGHLTWSDTTHYVRTPLVIAVV